MNIVLWVLQILLGLHTALGAFWKFSHSAEQTMPSLAAIPPAVWLGMSVVELACGALLILPALVKPLEKFAPFAALVVGAEMILFCVVHLKSGATDTNPIIYWIVVDLLCTFLAVMRWQRARA